MKRQSILKSTLCLLMALVCNVSWAQTNPTPIVSVDCHELMGLPYALSDDDAALIFAKQDVTIVADVTTFSSLSGRGAIVSASDPTQPVCTSATKTNSPYFAYGHNDANFSYLASSRDGDRFSGGTLPAGATSRVVIVVNKTGNNYKVYVNGVQQQNISFPTSGYELQNFSQFASNENAKIYIGGGVTSAGCKDIFDGYFHSVKFYEGAFTAEQVTALGTTAKASSHSLYYMAADTKQSNGTYVRRYLYNNNGTLATSTDLVPASAKFVWSVTKNANGKYIIVNQEGKSLGNNGDYLISLQDAATPYEIASTEAVHVGSVGLKNATDGYTGSKYMVTKADGTAFNRNSGKVNNGSWSSDYIFEPIDPVVDAAEDFVNGGVYTFVTARGWMGATESNTKVISTARTSVSDTNTDFFKWTVYKSNNGNYYLYNVGKQQFMGVQSANNTEIDFVATPAGKKLTFKQSSSTDYPIMLSTDNNGVVNHSANHGGGLINWTGGWNTLNDEGSNHKVTLVSMLPEATLQEIAAEVAAYDRSMPIKVEVEGWTANNPNTHFGNVTATTGSNVSSTKLLTAHMAGGNMAYSSIGDVVTFTREYRGFEFQGYYAGEQSLGKSFTITEELASSITAENPLVAKFATTDDVTIWYDDDPFSYRIPAIGKTTTGRLIAVSDYRYSLDDIGRYNYGTANPGIDLVIRMSDDNGKTWGPTKPIAKGSCVRHTNDCAYGDAAIAVVGQKVLVMGAAGDVMFGNGSATAHNRTVRIFSEDNGVTWTAPQDISETLFIGDDATIKNGYTAFFGSGKLAVDENYNGTGNARIYGAMLIKKEGCNNAIYVIYTDDFGVTWSILGGSQTHITANDEPKVEILPSGQILLSVRRGGGRQFNVFTYTDKATNAGSWNSNVNGCSNGGSNTCNGEIYVVDAKKANGDAVKLLLQSQPKGGSGLYDRRDVTIWYKEITNAAYTSSEIAGNWIQGMQVSTQLSSYSTMVLQEDGRIAFFFEEAPCYGDDYAKGYSMVYTPLTIEGITKGKYFSPTTDLNATQTISVVLTDAQGNEYRDQVESTVAGVAAALATKYPFITMGDNANLSMENGAYTYTNSVRLPFKVSGETEVWHNIYFMSNKINNVNYPVYLSASAANNEFVTTSKDGVAGSYGDNSWNTLENADKISWAVYNVGNGFTFKFKNKLTGKFIQVTNVASGNAQNVKYVDEADATAFELVPSSNNFYAVKAPVSGTDGYLCCTSASYGYATHFSRYNHAGGTMTFAEAPDFAALIADINGMLGTIGTSLGQYNVTEANTEALEAAKEAMQNSATVKLNTLNSYKTLLNGATLNMPKDGQYFRVAYDYGGNVGKLYMQGEASSVKGVQFTAETGDASIWQYRDGTLYSCSANKNLREYGDDRGLSDTKTTVAFSASSRAKGKYNIKCGSFIHANSSNGSYFTDHCSGDGGHAAHDLILEEVEGQAFTLNVTSAKYATLYLDYAAAIPSDVEVYIAKSVEGDRLIMAQVTGVLPAETGVIVRAEAGTYRFAQSDATPADVTGNMLKGTATSEYIDAIPGHEYYVLANKEGIGMYRPALNGDNQFKNNANKAYLEVNLNKFGFQEGSSDTTAPGGQLSNRLRFDFSGTTSIEKTTDNGQETAVIYDLTGRRVENPAEGIYIVGGKKVMIK